MYVCLLGACATGAPLPRSGETLPARAVSLEDDTLTVELTAISNLLAAHPSSRVVALDPRFARAGQAPAVATATLRPVSRQRALEMAIRSLGDSTSTDTIHVQASAPAFSAEGAGITVTVQHRRNTQTRMRFYETIEYFLTREAGGWTILRHTRLGIS